MNTTKAAKMLKCQSCACGECAASEMGNIYALNSALDNAYAVLGVGLVFFDGNKNVTHLNQLARRRLKLPEEYILTGRDFFGDCFDRKYQTDLKKCIDQLYSEKVSEEIKLNIPIRGEDNVVMLQRLEKTAFGINAPGVAMFIFESNRNNDSSAADVARIFGLTKTEAKLTLAIVNGMTATEYSEQHGVSINTAYSQIKDVLAKTGTRRQAELVKLVLEHSPGLEKRKNNITVLVDRRRH
jgi:DNA-binding CsgD family transcriptional regulator